MIRDIHIWLWGIIAELEHTLYPWKTNNPPDWAVERYNLDHGIEEDENSLYYEWIKSHDQKINKVEENIINLYKEIELLKQNDSSI
tara:strand:- start:55 stop:312 length:258 start_codon:yes stop_codon:yes gene_type:complete